MTREEKILIRLMHPGKVLLFCKNGTVETRGISSGRGKSNRTLYAKTQAQDVLKELLATLGPQEKQR